MVLEVQEDRQHQTAEARSTRYQENHQDRVLQQNHRGPRLPLDLSNLPDLLDLQALLALLDLPGLLDLQFQPLRDLHRQQGQLVLSGLSALSGLQILLPPSRLYN